MPRMIVVALALVGLVNSSASAQQPAAAVKTATAKVREVQMHRRITGSLRAVARGSVAALEEGRVTEVTVREGAEVSKGDVIARIDTRRMEAQRRELLAMKQAVGAQIAQRTAEVQQAKQDLERHAKLVEKNATSIELYQHRETAVTVAEAQLLGEQARLSEIENRLDLVAVRLDDAVVLAPYDGRVVERHAEPGEWIKAGEPFVTLVSSGAIEAWLDVPERFLPELSDNDGALLANTSAVSVKVRGSNRDYKAISAKRISDVHARTRTFPLVLTLDDADGTLTPGMSIDAWIPLAPRESQLTAPKDAVIRNGRTAYVYKAVGPPGAMTAVQAGVNVLFETGDLVVVESDALSDGDAVIVEGNERLMPNAAVTIVNAQRDEEGRQSRTAALP